MRWQSKGPLVDRQVGRGFADFPKYLYEPRVVA
jgi:hypothetical protein